MFFHSKSNFDKKEINENIFILFFRVQLLILSRNY